MGTMHNIVINAGVRYHTWDVFKRAVERDVGHYVSNNLWLQAKPKKALPWSESDMQATSS